tara:strand:- start:31285 stop:31977 length:693 start_codon:yes stop_codon:yes gene_type:complete
LEELIFVLVEAALETLPREMWSLPSIQRYVRKKRKNPNHVLLDRSFHHGGMLQLKDAERRGRPDLVHFSLLEANDTPLFFTAKLQIYVHTYNDFVIAFDKNIRLPKSYHRFAGLIEQAFEESTRQDLISGVNSSRLIQIRSQTFEELVMQTSPSVVIGLTTHGKLISGSQLSQEVISSQKPMIAVGGFPKGHFTSRISNYLTSERSIHPSSLGAHVVTARTIYDIEKALR